MFNKSTCVRIADLQRLHLQCHPSAARNGPAVQKSFCWQPRSSPPLLEPDDLNPGIPLKFPFTYLPCIGNSPHDPEIHIPLHLSLDTVHCFSNRLRVIPFLTLSDGNSRHSSDSIKKCTQGFWCIIKRLGFFGCIIKRFGIWGCAPYGRKLKRAVQWNLCIVNRQHPVFWEKTRNASAPWTRFFSH